MGLGNHLIWTPNKTTGWNFTWRVSDELMNLACGVPFDHSVRHGLENSLHKNAADCGFSITSQTPFMWSDQKTAKLDGLDLGGGRAVQLARGNDEVWSYSSCNCDEIISSSIGVQAMSQYFNLLYSIKGLSVKSYKEDHYEF